MLFTAGSRSWIVLIMVFVLAMTLPASINAKTWTIEDFFQHRPDVRDNISKWSGQTDPEWILREWIKITYERGDDYHLAIAILNGTQQPDSGSPPQPGPIEQPSDGFAKPSQPVAGFVRPAEDNGWGIHWFPTVSQSKEEVDRFVSIISGLHIKWVLFLNPGTDLHANEHLVDSLVKLGIMPVMRLYYSTITAPSSDEIRQTRELAEYYTRRGVQYFQIYNEPNLPCEWEGNRLPENSIARWAEAFVPRARAIIDGGGIPGIGGPAFGYIKTDGSYGNGSEYFRQMTGELVSKGHKDLLARCVVVIHNYTTDSHPSDRAQTEKYWQFATYQAILAEHGLLLPMIGGEGGTRPEDVGGNMSKLADNVFWCYEHMATAPDYYMSFAHWLLAAPEGNEWRRHAMFDSNGAPLQKELIEKMRTARPRARGSSRTNTQGN